MKTFIVAAIVAVVLAVTCKESSAAPAPQFNFGQPGSYSYQPSIPNFGSPYSPPFSNPKPFEPQVYNPRPFDPPVNSPSRPVINLPPYKEPTLIDRLKEPFVDTNRPCNPTIGGGTGRGFGVTVGVECKW